MIAIHFCLVLCCFVILSVFVRIQCYIVCMFCCCWLSVVVCLYFFWISFAKKNSCVVMLFLIICLFVHKVLQYCALHFRYFVSGQVLLSSFNFNCCCPFVFIVWSDSLDFLSTRFSSFVCSNILLLFIYYCFIIKFCCQ